MSNPHRQAPRYTPAIREPLPLRRKPYILPAPPEMAEKPQKIDWLRTILPPVIMMAVLSLVAAAMQATGFIVYTVVMLVVYPIARLAAYLIQTSIYNRNEARRKAAYAVALDQAEREIIKYISSQRKWLKEEYPPTASLLSMAEGRGSNRHLWYRTSQAVDFLALRTGIYDGQPSFEVQVPKGDDIDSKDPLLAGARHIREKYQSMQQIPFLLPLQELGSVAIVGEENRRYGLARRLLLDVLAHHRPDEVEVFVLSSHKQAARLWSWLRWAPHCQVFDESKELEHLVFGSPAVKIFLARLESYFNDSARTGRQVFIIDVDGIQQYDDEFVSTLTRKALEWKISLIFTGGSQLPRGIRGMLKLKDQTMLEFVDTLIDEKDKGEKEYHTEVECDELPGIDACERAARALAGVQLLSSSGDAMLSPNISLYDVLQKGKEGKLNFNDVLANWGDGSGKATRSFNNRDLLQFPIGLAEDSGRLSPFSLNLLEARYGGLDAFHTMLIGTTGSGKSEFIKSLILGAAYKYPPQYLNFFCMDFKGGSTVDQLSALPHVVGVMTNLDEVMSQRGLIAIRYEIDRRQAEFNTAGKKDIWEYNEGRPVEQRMPHLVLILDEFTRGLDLLNTPEYNLQDLLEKRLAPQGRSLGIYLILANQVANAKAMKLLPNVGWRIALRVASRDQMNFIAQGLKPPRVTGRGYIQAIGADPVEFQSGYSGNYVQSTNLPVTSRSIEIKELLPNGSLHPLRGKAEPEADTTDYTAFLEMNQVIQAVQTAQTMLGIKTPEKIYNPPLPRRIVLDQLNNGRYRSFSAGGWSQDSDPRHYLQAPAGRIDLVQKCAQETLRVDFMAANPHLLLVGSQTDIIDGLRSVLFPLLLAHSPTDVQLYLMEFGKGLRDMPAYPHIADLVEEHETERIFRTVEYFEAEFSRRAGLQRASSAGSGQTLPHLFLVINNIAGLKDNLDLYPRIYRFVLQESHRYGIHVIILSLPRGSGTRVPSGDLKTVKSRIVFSSINQEDFWYYLDVADRKLVKLTGQEKPEMENGARTVARAYWLCAQDPRLGEPVELQLITPQYQGLSDDDLAEQMRGAGGYAAPEKIRVLESKYPLPEMSLGGQPERGALSVGIRWTDLQACCIPIVGLPPVWGVSGPRESGKTNFLTAVLHQMRQALPEGLYEVFAPFPNPLASYCEERSIHSSIGPEQVLKRLVELEAEGFRDDRCYTLFIDDLNIFWERDTDDNKKIRACLENLSSRIYGKHNIMVVAAFSYSPNIKAARSRDGLVRELHDNKTGLCLGYEGDWVLSSIELANLKKKVEGVPGPGRGVFVFKGQPAEIQAFYFERGEE